MPHPVRRQAPFTSVPRMGGDQRSCLAFGNELSKRYTVWICQLRNAALVDSRDNNEPGLCIDTVENFESLHPLRLVLIIFCRAQVVDRPDLVALNQEEVRQRHQSLLSQQEIEGVLISNGQQLVAMPVLNVSEDYIGDLGL